MEEEIEIRKVPVQTRTSIPAIAVTAIVMIVALGAIIAIQKYANAPHPAPQPAVQTQPH
ncbi:MAG: hypothetical protein K2Y42_03325 [Hyphomicrobium sp.]|jgi:hypothetical protein|uniref:hypothetical protein n=1 Tax=Hyphomicrobium sp. TaxID=82 RepID=UPI0025BE8DAD|nr:hypothetical protein [Hyphomicrobium sp.]MBX9861762.1 hypothetical protein [Hyphomicrobium sp.]